VVSLPGQGTSVTVYFAMIAATARPVGPEAWRGTQSLSPLEALATVLVVEDDEAVRALAARTLGRAGYTVLTAADGLDAVEVFRAHSDDIACVVLDLVLPRLQGEAVCQALKASSPSTPIVAMSGYLESAPTTQVATVVSRILQKPFTPQTLRDAVRTAIRERV
jgi:CheY-like chemotaxis protein